MFTLVKTVVVTAVACVAAYFVVIFHQRKWLVRNFSGPFALPLLGNCYDLRVAMFLKYLIQMKKRYGKIFTFFSFTKCFLVISDKTMVRRILSDVKTFAKGSDYSSTFAIVFGEGLVTSNGEKHKRDRAALGKYFTRANLSKYTQNMNKIAKATIAQYVPADVGCFTLNVENLFAKIAIRTFMKFALTIDLSDQPKLEDKICHDTSAGSNAIGRMIVFNFPLWNIFPEVRLLNECNRYFRPIFREWIEKRKQLIAEKNGEAPDDCLSAMVREGLPEENMVDHIATLIAGGHDTTAFFISYMVYLLAQHPTEQAKLYEEIQKQVGIREEVTCQDLTEMKYLQYVMMETLRYFAIVPCITREVSEDVSITSDDGKLVTIPKGVTVLISIVNLNRDPEVWEAPNEFRPSRFAEQGKDFTCAKSGFYPFGYGSR